MTDIRRGLTFHSAAIPKSRKEQVAKVYSRKDPNCATCMLFPTSPHTTLGDKSPNILGRSYKP